MKTHEMGREKGYYSELLWPGTQPLLLVFWKKLKGRQRNGKGLQSKKVETSGVS
jgi:hypothetical protein